jgi:CHASE2 domain-containing sensor protein
MALNNNLPGKHKLWTESLLATILVFLVIWLFFSLINISFKPFNYVAKALKEVQLTDIYFSQLHNDNADTNIILVNVENLDRRGIAQLIDKIVQANPRVIGLDLFISKQPDIAGDSLLAEAFRSAGNKLVLAEFINPDKGEPDSSYKVFPGYTYGHANLPNNEDGTAVLRSFIPRIKQGNQEELAFAARIVQKYSPGRFTNLLERDKPEEMINYTGDINTYLTVNHREIMQGKEQELNFMKGKIVMLGFIGGTCRNMNDMEDLFYTPVNPHYYGRSHPDMYGLVVHANIVSMILSNNYIYVFPAWLLFIISFLIVYLHVVLFTWFFTRHHLWYHTGAKMVQLISFTIILFLVFILFRNTQVLVQTKFMILGIILSVDILYFYEALALFSHKIFGSNSLFVKHH